MFAVLSIVVGAAAIGLWHPGQAAAAESCAPQVRPHNLHCYAIALWDNIARGYEGESARIRPVCLRSGNPATNFVTEEMWEGTDNSGHAAYWIEEGAITHPTPRWVWANFYPGATKLWEFFQGPSVTLGKTYLAQMMYVGKNKWQILATLAGQTAWELDATAHYQPPYTKYLAAGTEYTSAGDRTRGSATSLQYLRSNGLSWGDWFGAKPKAFGPHHYATAKMPNGHAVDWSTPC